MKQQHETGTKAVFEKPQISTVSATRIVEQLGVAVAVYPTAGGGGIIP